MATTIGNCNWQCQLAMATNHQHWQLGMSIGNPYKHLHKHATVVDPVHKWNSEIDYQ